VALGSSGGTVLGDVSDWVDSQTARYAETHDFKKFNGIEWILIRI
jgi:hypothetical protein